MRARPASKRTTLIMHETFYKKAHTAITNLRSDSASGDRKLFKQAWLLEKRLEQAWSHHEANTFAVRITVKQNDLLQFAMRRK